MGRWCLLVALVLLATTVTSCELGTSKGPRPQTLTLMSLDKDVAPVRTDGVEAIGPVAVAPAPEIRPQPAATPALPVVAPTQTFAGRPLRVKHTMWMTVTAYSPDARSCGKWADGITASGYSVETNGMKLVAADTRLLPFGSLLTIPGYHAERPVPVLDRGGKIKGSRLDVLFPTHEQARKWGRQQLLVTVWEYAD